MATLWIGELRVTNFRCLRGEYDLKLERGLNIIYCDGPDNTWIKNLTEAIKASLGCYEADQQKSILYTTPDNEINWGEEEPHCSSEADIIDEDRVYTCSFRATLNEKGERDIHSNVSNRVASMIGRGALGEIFLGGDELNFVGILEDTWWVKKQKPDPQLLNLKRFLINAREQGRDFVVVEDPGFIFCGESNYDPLVDSGFEQVIFLTDDAGSVESLGDRAQNTVKVEIKDWFTDVLIEAKNEELKDH